MPTEIPHWVPIMANTSGLTTAKRASGAWLKCHRTKTTTTTATNRHVSRMSTTSLLRGHQFDGRGLAGGHFHLAAEVPGPNLILPCRDVRDRRLPVLRL